MTDAKEQVRRKRHSQSNESFEPTKPLVTALAGSRPAPNAFAAEPDVRNVLDLRIAF